MRIHPAPQSQGYKITLEPLSIEDGGGWFASVPELSGCFSDGETPQEALQNIMLAMEEWLEVQTQLGRSIPKPQFPIVR